MSSEPTVSNVTLRIADGTTFVVQADSAADYILDRAFVRFVALGLVIYAILMRREFDGISSPTQYVALWASLFVVIVTWLLLTAGGLLYLYKHGWIKTIYTPLLSMPLAVVNEFTVQFLAYVIAQTPLDFSSDTFVMIVRQMAVLLCFDLLHGYYVTPTHPLAVQVDRRKPVSNDSAHGTQPAFADAGFRQDIAPRPAAPGVPRSLSQPLPQDPPEEAPLKAQPDSAAQDMVQLGNKDFQMRKILAIRSEDHYLHVSTTQGDTLVRAKLSDAEKALDVTLGMRINRSSWIAFSAVDKTQRIDNNRLEVLFKNGDTFTVPKLRKHAFEHSFRMFLDMQGSAQESDSPGP